MNARRILATAIATVAVTGGLAAPALATTTNVGGGTWSYGTSSSSVYSNYLHPTRLHGSSVKRGDTVFRSNCAAAGTWAKASASKSWYQVDYSYYRFCD